jgi:hypothetical protein
MNFTLWSHYPPGLKGATHSIEDCMGPRCNMDVLESRSLLPSRPASPNYLLYRLRHPGSLYFLAILKVHSAPSWRNLFCTVSWTITVFVLQNTKFCCVYYRTVPLENTNFVHQNVVSTLQEIYSFFKIKSNISISWNRAHKNSNFLG